MSDYTLVNTKSENYFIRQVAALHKEIHNR